MSSEKYDDFNHLFNKAQKGIKDLVRKRNQLNINIENYINSFQTIEDEIYKTLFDAKEYYNKNKDFAKDLAKIADKPILIEIWNERYFYFVIKFEFNVIDSLDKASALSTVQIDVENAERFNITYADEQGKKQHPFILHTSISGSIDRCVYALLEREAIKMKQGKKPMLPLWLSPTQIRFIPVSEEFIIDCEKFIEEMNKLSEYHQIWTNITNYQCRTDKIRKF